MTDILPSAAVFIPSSKLASELPCARGGGEPSRPSSWPVPVALVVAGRCEIQSWTRRETFGFERRLEVLRDDGLVVIIMVGFTDVDVEENGVEARYV